MPGKSRENLISEKIANALTSSLTDSPWSSMRKVEVRLNEAAFDALQSLVDRGGFGSINAYVHTLFALGERLAEHRQQGFTELANVHPESGEQRRVTDLGEVDLDIKCSGAYESRLDRILEMHQQNKEAERAEVGDEGSW